ncbi:MAG: hypothetical protein ACYC61_19650 [Isosphaeraceae bacterium]
MEIPAVEICLSSGASPVGWSWPAGERTRQVFGWVTLGAQFRQKAAEDILKPEELDRYRSEMRYFHDHLSVLHHNLYFVQQIADFPFDLFVHPAEDLFLRFVADNFLQVSILDITKLTTDSGGDAHTLRQFNTFMNGAVRDEYLDEYRNVLREARFTPRTNDLIDRAKALRDRQIAHSIAPRRGERPVHLSFGEIREIAQELTKLFEIAAFDAEYHYLTVAYNPAVRRPMGGDHRPDIERILDGVARDSPVLRLPESNPIAWEHSSERRSDAWMSTLNRYRRKLGLPEV